MAFSENGNGLVMPVGPMNGYGGGNCFGGDNGWLVILFLFALMGGNFGNGFGGGNNGVLPYLYNDDTKNAVNRGFDTAGLSAQLSGIQNAVSNGFASAEVAECNRSMNLLGQFNAVQSQLANCCCENRLATANLGALVQSENCADRAALSDGIRDIIANQTEGTQRILDMMCQDKIDAKNEKIAELQNQLNMLNLAQSQTAQTAALLADNNRQTTVLEDYLNPVARPAYIVQNPNCCAQYGYGYGCSA